MCKPLKERSFFLFGARGTGKTHLLRRIFKDAPTIWLDLLRDDEVLELTRNPSILESRLRRSISSSTGPLWVVIDEVQKVPSLLNEVHRILEEPEYQGKIKFALTGSSARKLKRGGANLLAGRALLNYLFPLTYRELGEQFLIEHALTWGTLPNVINSTSDLERAEVLRAYFSVYLKEEIKEEQIVRKLDPFLRFLEVAAQVNGEPLNFARIGRDCLVDEKQVVRYFQILEDTLIGFFLQPFHESIRKRQTAQSKFYFF